MAVRIVRKSNKGQFCCRPPISPEQCEGCTRNASLHTPYRPWNALGWLPDFHQIGDIGIVFTRASLQFEPAQPLHNLIEFHSETRTCNQSTTRAFAISGFSTEPNLTLSAVCRKIIIYKIMGRAEWKSNGSDDSNPYMKSHRKSICCTFFSDWWHLVVTLVTY